MTQDNNLQTADPIHVGIIVCPNFAAMDIFGVYTVFGVPPYLGLRPNITVHLLWKDTAEFNAIPPFPMRATTTFSECPSHLDVLALGALPPSFLEDDEALDFVATAGSQASYLIGICGGALILGAAGLLQGLRATTNFHALDQLAIVGAIPTKGHVVVDRNCYTSGPAIGAYDASLLVLGKLCGEEIAREHELHLEHLAEPPFRTGRPELAGEELTQRAMSRLIDYAEDTQKHLIASCLRRGVKATQKV